ncbi:hypothetical protein GGD83_002887 [Rhodoblastus sphagnicola]|nr:hypothetical protein [Rhodoblastus sphagnicola]MBB4199076.1 hypothetical protein [Rhodoblastus sphagnicola]
MITPVFLIFGGLALVALAEDPPSANIGCAAFLLGVVVLLARLLP